MSPKITVWVQDGCACCAAVADWFRAHGYEVETRSAELSDLATEPEAVRNAVMADLQMQDGALPLVYVGKKIFPFDDVESIIDSSESSIKKQ